MVSVQNVLIALGSNRPSHAGSSVDTVSAAILTLSKHGFKIRCVSRFFRTPSFPDPQDPAYVNACVSAAVTHNPEGVLTRLHDVETAFGRARETRWGERSLDLDLIGYDQRIVPDLETVNTWISLPISLQKSTVPDRLLVPHPRLIERGFVLVPLADIAPDWRHPITQQTTREMRDKLPHAECKAVQPITGSSLVKP